jgi:signal transduction histidine kinase
VTAHGCEQDQPHGVQASYAELCVHAALHAPLRRVATLVAHGVPSWEVFCAVAEEMTRCLPVQQSTLVSYEPDGTALLLAACGRSGSTRIPVGERLSPEGPNVAGLVHSTGRAARTETHDYASGSGLARRGERCHRCQVGAPIVVRGCLWGAAIVGTSQPEPLPPDTEVRVGDFADLVAAAIANAQTRAELNASRARIVAAADQARRRFERDLHDGAQQQLVSLGLQLRTVEASVPEQLAPLRGQLARIACGLTGISEELREIARGIRPAILSKGGLGPALTTLARRCALPVDIEYGLDDPLPESTEVAAYYVVAEALTNVDKHARASRVTVCAHARDANLHLSIRDNGLGGADPAKGSGLTGLRDRVEALGGTMDICSDAGRGTSLIVTIPLELQ